MLLLWWREWIKPEAFVRSLAFLYQNKRQQQPGIRIGANYDVDKFSDFFGDYGKGHGGDFCGHRDSHHGSDADGKVVKKRREQRPGMNRLLQKY